MLAFVLAVILAPFDLAISQPHPLCPQLDCEGLQVQLWGLHSDMPGTVFTVGVAIESAECTEAGPIATFHIVPVTDIVGFCVLQHFSDGSVSDCATSPFPVTEAGKPPPPDRVPLP